MRLITIALIVALLTSLAPFSVVARTPVAEDRRDGSTTVAEDRFEHQDGSTIEVFGEEMRSRAEATKLFDKVTANDLSKLLDAPLDPEDVVVIADASLRSENVDAAKIFSGMRPNNDFVAIYVIAVDRELYMIVWVAPYRTWSDARARDVYQFAFEAAAESVRRADLPDGFQEVDGTLSNPWS